MHTWQHAYETRDRVFNFDQDIDFGISNRLMSHRNVPETAHHMSLTESYPPTFDAIHGNYF